jgi:hypothetical protein
MMMGVHGGDLRAHERLNERHAWRGARPCAMLREMLGIRSGSASIYAGHRTSTGAAAHDDASCRGPRFCTLAPTTQHHATATTSSAAAHSG